MKNICVIGCGAMGTLVANKIKNLENYNLVGIVDKFATGENIYSDINLIKNKIDAIIDYSHPDNIDMICEYVIKNKCALVYCTTGYSINQKEKILNLAKYAPICITGNTSLGINLLKKLTNLVSLVLKDFDIEIIEKHHNKKKDSPSGTAKMLLNEIESVRNVSKINYGREEISVREKNEIGVHSVRGGTYPGEHTVIFAGDDEIIELKHTSLSKNIFVNGTIKILNFIIDKPNKAYSCDEIYKLY